MLNKLLYFFFIFSVATAYNLIKAQDSLYKSRFSKTHNNLNFKYHSSATRLIKQWAKKSNAPTAQALGRATFFFPYLDSVFTANNLPTDLKFVALAATLLDFEFVDSMDGARGIWHFNYSNARLYDLEISSFIDERRNYKKSTEAFVRAMKDYHGIYKDWELTVAAFVSSAIKVNKAIRLNQNEVEYFKINKDMEGLSSRIVSHSIAWMYLYHYRSDHQIEPVPFALPVNSVSAPVDNWYSLVNLSTSLHIPLSTLRWLNPDYRKNVIPDTEKKYELRVPVMFRDSLDKILAMSYRPYANVEVEEVRFEKIMGDSIRVQHNVNSGETIQTLSAKYNCSVEKIKAWNGLEETPLQEGQTLTIYIAKPKVPEKPKYSVRYHKVRSGDTLGGIALKYGCSVTELKRWNNIRGTTIYAGQKLKIMR